MIPCLDLNDETVVKDRAIILAEPEINFAERLHLHGDGSQPGMEVEASTTGLRLLGGR